MIRIVVTERSYSQHAEATLKIIGELVEYPTEQVVILDSNAVVRFLQQSKDLSSPSINVTFFSEWLTGTKLEPQKIRKTAEAIDGNGILLLDARDNNVDDIKQAIDFFQRTLFFYDTWPRGFVIIIDDFDSTYIAQFLSEKFYIIPRSLDPTELANIVKEIRRKALKQRFKQSGILPWFAKKLYKALRNTINRIRR